MGSFVDSARVSYTELGFDTLPLIGGSKKPYARAWAIRLPFDQWKNVPQDVNIGIRGGGPANVAFIDCDEPRSMRTVTSWLEGLGFRGDSYPVVQSASGVGRHIYITLTSALPGDARKLSREIGAGEFRYGAGAYVVAPPSLLNDGCGYSLISGDFLIRPALEVKDILPILGNLETSHERKPTPSRKARALLNGKNIENYSSRSEAEQALIASLVNSRFSFGEILDLFSRHPCAGKYAELKVRNAKNAERWLLKSYNEAVQWTKTHESKARQIAQAAIAWAETRAWRGKTGAVDQLVFIAHAEIAYKAGRLTYAASCRDLAERAGIGKTTATRATWRLCSSGLIVPDKKAVADSANIFQLTCLDTVGHSLRASIVRKCPTVSNHDVFRHSGLGKSAGQVWQVLRQYPASINELTEITGRHVKTIERALGRMSKLADPLTGECLPMVASEDSKTYYSLPVDLDRIARVIGTVGMAERQRSEHAKERRLHALGLANGKRHIR
jgi:hypothetical protein